jgi:hypothetical protein
MLSSPPFFAACLARRDAIKGNIVTTTSQSPKTAVEKAGNRIVQTSMPESSL